MKSLRIWRVSANKVIFTTDPEATATNIRYSYREAVLKALESKEVKRVYGVVEHSTKRKLTYYKLYFNGSIEPLFK